MREKLTDSDLRRYAVRGAEARLLELDKETASIYQSCAALRKPRGARRLPVAAVVTARAGQRTRRTMSAAQKQEVSQRMKRYWAQRRSAAAQGETGGSRDGTATARKSKAGRTAGAGRRRKMSAAARKRISDAQKARWAKRKKANA